METCFRVAAIKVLAATCVLQRAEDRHFMLQIALKCADICNPCRPWEVSRPWSLQVTEEFYRAQDLGRTVPLHHSCALCGMASVPGHAPLLQHDRLPPLQSGALLHHYSCVSEFERRAFDLLTNLTIFFDLQIKWDSILDAELSGRMDYSPQPEGSRWAELGILELRKY